MLLDLKIVNGKIATISGIYEGAIGVSKGKIKAIVKNGDVLKAEKQIDAKGKLVLPGAIDVHAHIYDPKFVHREDFEHGTLAAIFGGVTTVIIMPLDTHIDNVNILKHYIEVGERESYTDFSIQGGFIKSNNISNVEELAKNGVKAFKMFTCKPYMASDYVFIRMLELTKKLDILITVHAEDEAILEHSIRKALETKRKDPIIHHISRHPIAEKVAIEKLLTYLEYISGNMHLCHITTSYAVKAIEEGKRKGLNISSEVCTHHLLFTYNDAEKWGPYLKMNPPLRSRVHVEALWKGLQNGVIDIVTTDHAPGSRDEKEVGWEDIWRAWGGVAGVETLLPIMFTYGFKRNILSLEDIIRLLSFNPAKIFGLQFKGDIKPGLDADLLIIDPNFTKKVKAEDLHYKNPWTPYEGLNLYGWPEVVILRGNVIIENRELIEVKSLGRFIKAANVFSRI